MAKGRPLGLEAVAAATASTSTATAAATAATAAATAAAAGRRTVDTGLPDKADIWIGNIALCKYLS